jgi:hypothetical protein
MRSGRVGRKQDVKKLKKFFGGAGGEGIDRMRDNVGVNMVGQVEADGATARAAACGSLSRMVGTPAKSEKRTVTGIELR